MITSRRGSGLLVCALLTLLAACSSTTSGSGSGPAAGTTTTTAVAPTTSSTPPPAPTGNALVTGGPNSSAALSATATRPPRRPIAQHTVTTPRGTTYVVMIWADVRSDTCADHAYGAPMIAFLTKHPCRGLERVLGSTTVHGRRVGFAESITSFVGPASNPYAMTEAFTKLVTRDGTGNFDDLLRDGYRLPSGPASVPTPDAFNVAGQDAGISVWDLWYLDGATPDNDPALVRVPLDLFLQY